MTRIKKRKKAPPPPRRSTRRRRQRGYGFDIQKWLGKTGIEFHWPGYQYMGPGTKLKKRLARGDPGINRLDRLAKQHDIDYSRAKNLQDKWNAATTTSTTTNTTHHHTKHTVAAATHFHHNYNQHELVYSPRDWKIFRKFRKIEKTLVKITMRARRSWLVFQS